MSQKFHRGDWVRVAKDLGEGMSHFTADCEAIVLGSYEDQYGSVDDDDEEDLDKGDRPNQDYTLHLKARGRCSWYKAWQLTMIEPGRHDKLEQWEVAVKAECRLKGDLDWIFAHGAEVLEKTHGSSVARLASCFGLTDLWGRNGEGVTYYANARGTMLLAEPYIKTGDKAGWLKLCATGELLRRALT